MTADRPRRGRPRDDPVDERVLEAVVAELGEAGTAGFSVNAVCARARVAKRGVAARWPDRGALILTGLNRLAAGLEPPRTGALESDLHALAAATISGEDGPFAVAGSDKDFALDWTTTTHTGAPTVVTAGGPGSKDLIGYYQNTHLYEVVREVLLG